MTFFLLLYGFLGIAVSNIWLTFRLLHEDLRRLDKKDFWRSPETYFRSRSQTLHNSWLVPCSEIDWSISCWAFLYRYKFFGIICDFWRYNILFWEHVSSAALSTPIFIVFSIFYDFLLLLSISVSMSRLLSKLFTSINIWDDISSNGEYFIIFLQVSFFYSPLFWSLSKISWFLSSSIELTAALISGSSYDSTDLWILAELRFLLLLDSDSEPRSLIKFL